MRATINFMFWCGHSTATIDLQELRPISWVDLALDLSWFVGCPHVFMTWLYKLLTRTAYSCQRAGQNPNQKITLEALTTSPQHVLACFYGGRAGNCMTDSN